MNRMMFLSGRKVFKRRGVVRCRRRMHYFIVILAMYLLSRIIMLTMMLFMWNRCGKDRRCIHETWNHPWGCLLVGDPWSEAGAVGLVADNLDPAVRQLHLILASGQLALRVLTVSVVVSYTSCH